MLQNSAIPIATTCTLPQRREHPLYTQYIAKIAITSEKCKACFNIFHSESKISSSINSKIAITSEKYKACFNIFHSESKIYFNETQKHPQSPISFFWHKSSANTPNTQHPRQQYNNQTTKIVFGLALNLLYCIFVQI